MMASQNDPQNKHLDKSDRAMENVKQWITYGVGIPIFILVTFLAVGAVVIIIIQAYKIFTSQSVYNGSFLIQWVPSIFLVGVCVIILFSVGAFIRNSLLSRRKRKSVETDKTDTVDGKYKVLEEPSKLLGRPRRDSF